MSSDCRRYTAVRLEWAAACVCAVLCLLFKRLIAFRVVRAPLRAFRFPLYRSRAIHLLLGALEFHLDTVEWVKRTRCEHRHAGNIQYYASIPRARRIVPVCCCVCLRMVGSYKYTFVFRSIFINFSIIDIQRCFMRACTCIENSEYCSLCRRYVQNFMRSVFS